MQQRMPFGVCPPSPASVAKNYCPPPSMIDGTDSPGYQGYPVVLTAQVTVQASEPIDISPNTLRNQTAFPIYLHSLRWIVDDQAAEVSETDTPTIVQQPIVAGSGIEIMLQYLDKPITAQFTQLYLLGRSDGQISEQEAVGVLSSSDFLARGSYSSGEWRFDHPFRLDPGDAISARMLHRNLVSDDLVVTLILAGRGGVPAAKKRTNRVPYIASWTPPAMNPAESTATSPVILTSTSRDLVNHSGGALKVARLEGRLLRAQLANATGLNVDWVWPPPQYRTLLGGTTGNFGVGEDGALSVVIHDSKGNGCAVPGSNGLGPAFRQVFDPVSRSWECPHTMDAEDYYIVELTLSDTFSDADVLGTSIQPAIALIGYQEIG